MTLLRSPEDIPPVLLVGCGRMGRALMAGWRERGLSPSVIIDPDVERSVAGKQDRVLEDPRDIPPRFRPEAVVFAIKPQNAAAVIPLYQRYARHTVVLSIMAGVTLARLNELIGSEIAVVRAMPNTPAAVRQGMTVACAGETVMDDQRDLCDTLLHAIGGVAWVENESLIDPVTAISGGGPAYVFLLAELLEKAAMEQGIPATLARLMARQTIIGSGALLAASDDDASVLRRSVTSPKGTTEKALAILMAESAWPRLVSKAVEAATSRSRELGR